MIKTPPNINQGTQHENICIYGYIILLNTFVEMLIYIYVKDEIATSKTKKINYKFYYLETTKYLCRYVTV